MKQVYRPKFFFGKRRREAESLKKQEACLNFVDAFDRQLNELFLINNLRFVGQQKTLVYRTPEFKSYCLKKADDFGYIYYPWNLSLVKCVPESDYFKLKTNRNQALITAKEQVVLSKLKVGVFGMSVGSNIAFVLTQAGIANEIVIADFDELDTTNLNRIWAGVHQVGLNKAVIAARRIYEDNPFAKVTVLTKGISEEKLEELLRKKKLDLIVEEIDEMKMKIETRRLALRYKVPVLMITDNGDSAHLHIERYDLGYKKIFEKPLSYWPPKVKACKGPKDFADIVINDILGGPQNVDPNMMRSVKMIFNRELISWPQLGSAALLGGIATTVAIKSIVSGKNRKLFQKYPITALR